MWCWCCGDRHDRRSYSGREADAHEKRRETSSTAVEILKERFARGETSSL
jgi:uncharacterized membrane protein